MLIYWTKVISKVIFLTFIFVIPPTFAENPKPGITYDIQCGCFSDPLNATRFAYRLQKLGLSWYSIPSKVCTRFIVDVNVDWLGISYFINEHVEFIDAFLVKNHRDVSPTEKKDVPFHPTKETFTKIMAPYMQKQYQFGYYNPKRIPMKDEQAQIYTQTIYEAAEYYKLDPFLIFALGNFESYFSNILGDLNRLKRKVPDPAQGMLQILRSTARMIYEDMKNQNLPHTPQTFPLDLTEYPKAQIYFAAHYLHSLHQEYHGNQYMALLFYNARTKPNYNYPRKVLRFYQRAITHYQKSLEGPLDAKTLIVEAHHHNPAELGQKNKIVPQ